MKNIHMEPWFYTGYKNPHIVTIMVLKVVFVNSTIRVVVCNPRFYTVNDIVEGTTLYYNTLLSLPLPLSNNSNSCSDNVNHQIKQQL